LREHDGEDNVSHAKVNTKASGSNSLAGRARDAGAAAAKAAAASKAAQVAAAAAQTAAQNAAQTAAQAGQTAAAGVSKGVQQGVYSTRGWAAPVLHNAADYTTATLAPKVSAALHSTADQVSPEDTRKKGRSALTWSLLAAAVLAAIGAAATVVRKRYQDAMAADTEADATEAATEGTASPAGAAQAEADPSAATSTDAGVNGRVSTSGW
jgi:trimeric autotransporter adhesin